MNTTTRKFLILGLLILAILIPQTAQAASPKDDKVIFGGNYTLYEGDTLNGDLVVFGGTATLEEGSTVNGDVVVIGGRVMADGTVNGDLVGLGGYLVVESNAHVNGELVALGSGIERSEESQVTGNIVTSEDIPFEFDFPTNLQFPQRTPQVFTYWEAPLAKIFWFFFRLLIWTGVAILVILFFQDQAETVSQTALGELPISLGVGVLIAILAPVAILALIITILLSPLSLVAIFILFAAWVLGWAAISLEIGKRLMKSTNQTWTPGLYAGLGMFILFLILNGFKEVVPCVGWIPKFFVGMWGLGAVVLTKFGTQRYPKTGQPTSVAPEEVPPLNEGELSESFDELSFPEGLETEESSPEETEE